ncbi:MAG: 3-hydroxyacyl-CoA dehydrogenase NAD-binding domain-containing protein [Deferrisomatales bacterium]|nr:3-hydroxyacyl-CoA dehydrogenase NAD-binding domain-containing protein [Deferrisomatales bacterium]
MSTEIAVVGPGRMGVGIVTAILLGDQGHRVTLIDTKKREAGTETGALETALAQIEDNLTLLGKLGLFEGDPQTVCHQVQLSVDTADVAPCAYIFEALPEKIDLKREFYAAVGPLMGDESIVASATSTFQLDVFSGACSKPGHIVTAHWLNPAFLIPLVEIAHGGATHPWAVEKLQGFLTGIGKIPVTLRSSPGFIVPRIQVAAMNEAVRMLEEGVATAAEIDTAIKAGFGFRLGVLGLIEFIDLGGVDILSHAGNYLHSALGADHYKPPALVSQKMRDNEVGPRTGKGFFDYRGVDTTAMFRKRYQGFVELLDLYRKSSVLSFTGGIDKQ